ncbi:5'-3' exoribonuclease [Glycine max]|nr:5'-3' exoribonuclease [Glycine max]
MGDGCVVEGTTGNSNSNNNNNNKKKNKKKKNRGGSKKKMTQKQVLAFKLKLLGRGGEKLLFELHSHSKFSDGFFSPSKVVERAHINAMKVLALTDHETMSGIPEAVESACKYGIKIIPGVEISTIFSPRGDSEVEEPVHILAYYSCIGPSRFAGNGVAPGRLHVAHAMLEAGYVENLRQALAQYLFDGGPAYSTGSEPLAEEAIKMISHTGDVAVLAHPWALKNPVPIVRRLKEAGLHGMEVYKSDGRLAAYSKLADAYGLLKIGGSDYHGTGGHNESELGSVNLPVIVLHDFLKVARPIWCNAIREILECYAEEPSDSNLATITRFGRTRSFKGGSPLSCGQDLIDHLSSQEMEKCRV